MYSCYVQKLVNNNDKFINQFVDKRTPCFYILSQLTRGCVVCRRVEVRVSRLSCDGTTTIEGTCARRSAGGAAGTATGSRPRRIARPCVNLRLRSAHPSSASRNANMASHWTHTGVPNADVSAVYVRWV